LSVVAVSQCSLTASTGCRATVVCKNTIKKNKNHMTHAQNKKSQ